MRRILEQFPADRRPPVMLHLSLEFAKRGWYHGDLMAKAIDRDRIVYQVAYDFDGVICEGWYPADWVMRWTLEVAPAFADHVVALPQRAANWPTREGQSEP